MTKITFPVKQLQEFAGIDPVLRTVFWFLVGHWPTDLMEVTSIYRTIEHDRKIKGQTLEEYKRGIHTVSLPYRAMDIGVKSLGDDWYTRMFDMSQKINQQWVYDPSRPRKQVCYVKPHGTGPHIHLQVHPNTRRQDGVA